MLHLFAHVFLNISLFQIGSVQETGVFKRRKFVVKDDKDHITIKLWNEKTELKCEPYQKVKINALVTDVYMDSTSLN